MKIGFDGRYIFDKRGGVAGLRQYSTCILTAMAEIAPSNAYRVYLRQPDFQPDAFEAVFGPPEATSIQPRPVKGRTAVPTAVYFQANLPNALRQDRPDVLHCPDFLAPFWNFGPRVAKIINIHDLNVLRFRQNFTPRTYWAWRLQAQISARRADLILTLSEAAKQDVVRLLKVPPHKVRVTLAAADPIFSPAAAEEIARIKTKHNLERYIFWVGSLIPQKNLARLLQAFALLKQDGEIPHKLVLGGQNAWGSQQYQSLITTLGLAGQVVLTGFVSAADLVPLYSGADLFVFPSLYEGFGLPPLEAMACGTPVAVANVSSMPEVAGNAAEYFDPLDVADIAQAIRRVLSNPARHAALQKLGLARAAMFSWHRAAQQTLEAYQQVLSAQRAKS